MNTSEMIIFFKECVIECCASQRICDYTTNALALFEAVGDKKIKWVHLFRGKDGEFVFNVVGDNGEILRTENVNIWDREDKEEIQDYQQVLDILGDTFTKIVQEYNIEEVLSLYAPWQAPYILDDYTKEIYEHECAPEEMAKSAVPSNLPEDFDKEMPF